jgi:hypothetical protein
MGRGPASGGQPLCLADEPCRARTPDRQRSVSQRSVAEASIDRGRHCLDDPVTLDVWASSSQEEGIMSLAQQGSFAFGMVIGWFLYFVNRYRHDDVTLGDVATVIGAIGGGAVTALFGEGKADLFGAYGIGLASGFFGYLIILFIMVARSPNFDVDFMLDGRRKLPDGTIGYPDPNAPRGPVMQMDDDGAQSLTKKK